MTLPDVNAGSTGAVGAKPPNAELQRELERIRRSNVLGDGRVRDLFDYLVKRSAAGDSPKEVEIAIDVFGKKADFDVSQDALVRVYVHKLRRALQTYRNLNAGEAGPTIQIPRGSYRLVVETPSAVPTEVESEEPTYPPELPVSPSGRWTAPLWVAVLTALVGFLGGAAYFRPGPSELDFVRRSPAWHDLIVHDRPILIVVSDYYMFGELDSAMKIKRLIREPMINSKGDLDLYRSQHPGVADQFKDVGTRYLPTSIAAALRNVVPVLTEDSRDITISSRSVALSMVSELTNDTIKYADVIYIGYLNGLGSLEPVVFSGSRFSIDASQDGFIDNKTLKNYVSQTESQSLTPRIDGADPTYHDYGYFAQLRGPGGNIIVVIAGTRDEGVRQTAELFTNPKQLDAIKQKWHLHAPFEALVEVQAVNGVNFSGKILYAGPR